MRTGLDPDFPYGSRMQGLTQSFSKKSKYSVTQEDIERAKGLGLLNKETAMAELLRIAQILKFNGVDLSKISLTKRLDRRQNRKQKTRKLSELKQEGIDIGAIIESNRFRPRFSVWS